MVDITDSSGNLLDYSDYNVSIKDKNGVTVREGVWGGNELINTFIFNHLNQTVQNYIDFNPFTITISIPNAPDYQIVVEIDDNNKNFVFKQETFPFIVNGTLILKQGEPVRFIKN
jgi:hypothetical protein